MVNQLIVDNPTTHPTTHIFASRCFYNTSNDRSLLGIFKVLPLNETNDYLLERSVEGMPKVFDNVSSSKCFKNCPTKAPQTES